MERIYGSDSRAGMTKVTSWRQTGPMNSALPRTRVDFCGLMTSQISALRAGDVRAQNAIRRTEELYGP
jgi:hypothetical protein